MEHKDILSFFTEHCRSGVCSVIIDMGNKRIEKSAGLACHAYVRDLSPATKEKIKYLYSDLRYYPRDSLREASKEYLSFILDKRHSPFRSLLKMQKEQVVFKTDKGDFAYVRLDNLDVDGRVLLSFLVATRCQYEHVSFLNTWKHLRAAGFNRMETYYLIHVVYEKGGKLQPYTSNPGHTPFFSMEYINGREIPVSLSYTLLSRSAPVVLESQSFLKTYMVKGFSEPWLQPKKDPVVELLKLRPPPYKGVFPCMPVATRPVAKSSINDCSIDFLKKSRNIWKNT